MAGWAKDVGRETGRLKREGNRRGGRRSGQTSHWRGTEVKSSGESGPEDRELGRSSAMGKKRNGGPRGGGSPSGPMAFGEGETAQASGISIPGETKKCRGTRREPRKRTKRALSPGCWYYLKLVRGRSGCPFADGDHRDQDE